LMEKVNYELERTSRMKSDFLANMSHEIRTPMNAVIGMAEIALREELPANVRDCLVQIKHSGRNLLNIINDILDFSKIEAGKMEIIPEEYEPLSEVNDISHILQTRIGEKNVELFINVDTNLPHKLKGDSMRIRQVLINLANNAIKFTKEGFVLINISCERAEGNIMNMVFHVVDSGQGIKKEDIPKLFASFQQVNSRRNRNVEGTGLGLAISKSLCEAMGGKIGVSSEYGKGSDFWFMVPQEIIDEKPDLVVENVENKMAFYADKDIILAEQFIKEINKLGIEGAHLPSFEEYKPTGKKDYVFFKESLYNNGGKKFLEDHPEVQGVVLVPFDSAFSSDLPNLYITRKPESTLLIVLAFNNADVTSLITSEEEADKTYFTAPSAKVLIVDDNMVNISIAEGLLAPTKVKCFTAMSGLEAIEKARSEQFDLILMDHMMPGMDGVEATKRIKNEIPSAKETPIIALTANVMEGSKEMFIRAGMADFIAKPIDVKQLNRKMREWLPADKIVYGMDEKNDKDKADSTVKEEELFDCLDCKEAVSKLGSAELYKSVVKEYYNSGWEILSEIQKAYEEGDIEHYAIKVHTLKSTSYQIGAHPMGDISKQLEMAAKEKDLEAVRKLHPVLLKEFEKLFSGLSKYFTESVDKTELKEATDDELKEIFERLKKACDELEMDEMEACAELLKEYSYPENKKNIIERLLTAIEHVDPDECISIAGEYFK
nr:response regulator [Lachnospiraceae bacterium]